MAIINIKFTKFDNTPWGFRLAGGSDFPHPLTVIRVTEGSLAECMGLKEGDVVVRLNDEPIANLTHGQAHQALMMAGNNFVLAVQREEEALGALQAISDENIVPYKIPLADLPPVFPEEILREETITQRYEEEIIERVAPPEEEIEKLPDKPKDANSETVPNENLTDEEIAQLILVEEELIVPEQGVLGVNFKKPRPLVPTLRGSKVLEELQHVASAPPPEIEERKRVSTFLKKPERPIPTPRKQKEEEAENVESYKVVIKKQSKKSVTARLLEKGLLTPESLVQQQQEQQEEPPEVKMYDPIVEPNESVEEPNETGNSEVQRNEEECLRPIDSVQSLLSNVSPITTPPSADEEVAGNVVIVTSSCEPSADNANRSPCRYPPSVVIREEESNVTPRKCAIKLKRLYTRAHYFERSLLLDTKKRNATKCTEIIRRSHSNDRLGKAWQRRIKGHYIENYLRREDTWLRLIVRALLSGVEAGFGLSGAKTKRHSKPHYGERAILEFIEFFVRNVRQEMARQKRFSRSNAKRFCPRAGYFQRIVDRDLKCLVRLARDTVGSCVDTQGSNVFYQKRRLSLRGRYFERNVNSMIEYAKDMATIYEKQVKPSYDRRCSFTKMKGKYLENCLAKRDLTNVTSTLVNFVESIKQRLECGGANQSETTTLTAPAKSRSRRCSFDRAHYGERVIVQNLEILGNVAEQVASKILEWREDSQPPEDIDLSVIEEEKKGTLSKFLRSTGHFVSAEVFHRGGRRLSRSSKVNKVAASGDQSGWLKALGRFCGLNLPALAEKDSSATCEEKIVMEPDRDANRRLSFVPTVLYEGLTNRIGVDFTKLVAYAFVPCTSVVLLYFYK